MGGERIADLARRYWLEASVFLIANGFLVAVLGLNSRPVGLAAWTSKAAELAAFSLPQSNFYPIGPALLFFPFHILGLNAVWPLFFYFNIGLFLYAQICWRIENRFVGRMALLAILLNPYFFWLLKSSQDTVLQFALLTAALRCLIARRLVAYSLLAVLASVVRSTDIFVFAGLALLMYFQERRAIWALFPALYAIVIMFNFAQYGSVSPSLNGGYNVFLGQHPLYSVAHPRYDIDKFFEREGHGDPNALFGMPRTLANEKQLDEKYRSLGLSFIAENPQRFIYISAIKLENWLFNFEKVPNLSGDFYLSKDGKQVVVASLRSHGLAVDAAYIVYKIFYNLLFAVALFLAAMAPRYALRSPYLPLLLPMFFVAPVILLTFPDTRFKIVYEVLALPAILVFAAEAGARLKVRTDGTQV
ncbi:hypothetical protein [Parvibaculum sp.]|uniref:hypothetical protein n=1 Tax=Parvibaculum sp. TaxID=2024848 RepID=UPI00320ED0CA